MITKNWMGLALLLLVSSLSVAQPVADKKFIGGSFNFTSSSSKDVNGSTTVDGPSSTSFSIQPRMGIFLSETLAAGAGIGFTTNSTTSPRPGDDDIISSNSLFTIAPFVRHYFISNTFGFFGEAGLNLGFGGSKVKVGSTTNDGPKVFNLDLGIRPGMYYYLNENFALEGTFGFLGFSRYQEKDENDNKEIDSSFGLRLNTASINFGFIYQF